jgi:hypothetical protein
VLLYSSKMLYSISETAQDRRRPPSRGKNYAVAHDVDRGFRRTFDAAEVEFVGLPRLIKALSAASPVGERLTPAGNRDSRAGREKSHGKKP